MRVYLDWNATTPPFPAVTVAMSQAASDAWGNPASVHTHGRRARARVESLREALAELAGCDPRDVVLASGGTEANNLAVRSAFARSEERTVLVTSRLEHPSITRVAEALERERRAKVHWLRVSPDGTVDLDELRRVLAEGSTRLVTAQAVNHETGVLQPVAEMSALAREHGAALHVDAVQAWGRVKHATDLGDTRSLAGHKIRGPKGIGALIVRPGAHVEPLLRGGAQERGVRPGTVDPIACAGLAVAAVHALSGPSRHEAVLFLRDELEAKLLGLRPGVMVNGTASRAPHVSNLFFPGWTGPELVAAMDLEGVSISSGSACSAGTSEASSVLTAMLGEARSSRSVRLSLGEDTTREEILFAAAAFERVLARSA